MTVYVPGPYFFNSMSMEEVCYLSKYSNTCLHIHGSQKIHHREGWIQQGSMQL